MAARELSLSRQTVTSRAGVAMPRFVAEGNMVLNGDFAKTPPANTPTTVSRMWINGTASGSSSDATYGWGTGGNSSGTSAAFDTTVSHSGNASLRLKTTVGGIAGAYSIGKYDVPLYIKLYAFRLPSNALNSTYTLSYWMKTTHNSGSANTGATAGIIQWNSSGTTLAGNNFNTGVLGTTEWTYYTLQVKITNPASSYLEVYAQIRGHDGAGTLAMDAWFDDISLTATTAPPRNLT
jgi:hypothetical protein